MTGRRCAAPGCDRGHWHSATGRDAEEVAVPLAGLELLIPLCDVHHQAVADYVRPTSTRIGELLLELAVLVRDAPQLRRGRRAA